MEQYEEVPETNRVYQNGTIEPRATIQGHDFPKVPKTQPWKLSKIFSPKRIRSRLIPQSNSRIDPSEAKVASVGDIDEAWRREIVHTPSRAASQREEPVSQNSVPVRLAVTQPPSRAASQQGEASRKSQTEAEGGTGRDSTNKAITEDRSKYIENNRPRGTAFAFGDKWIVDTQMAKDPEASRLWERNVMAELERSLYDFADEKGLKQFESRTELFLTMAALKNERLTTCVVINCISPAFQKEVDKHCRNWSSLTRLTTLGVKVIVTREKFANLGADVAVPSQNDMTGWSEHSTKFPIRYTNNYGSLCGLQLRIRLDTDTSRPDRIMTLGGLIRVDNKLFGLTVAHSILRYANPERVPYGSRRTSWDIESSEAQGEYSERPDPFQIPLQNLDWNDSDLIKWGPINRFGGQYLTGDQSSGQLWKSANPYGLASRNSDWALLKLDLIGLSRTFPLRNVNLDPLSYQYEIMDSLSIDKLQTGPVVIHCDAYYPPRGYLAENTSILQLEGSSLRVRQITVPELLKAGISGAWVTQAGQLCGHVVAVHEKFPWVYMLPIEDIFKDIAACLPAEIVKVASESDIKDCMNVELRLRSQNTETTRVTPPVSASTFLSDHPVNSTTSTPPIPATSSSVRRSMMLRSASPSASTPMPLRSQILNPNAGDIEKYAEARRSPVISIKSEEARPPRDLFVGLQQGASPEIFRAEAIEASYPTSVHMLDGLESISRNEMFHLFVREELSMQNWTYNTLQNLILGGPKSFRPLHEHLMMNRKIIITERMDLHLITTGMTIFVKPLPLFALTSWVKDMNVVNFGFFQSYSELVKYPSDFSIAQRYGLMEGMDWPQWKRMLARFPTLQGRSLSERVGRWQYGEINLSTLILLRFKLPNGLPYHSIQGDLTNTFMNNLIIGFACYMITTTALQALQLGLFSDTLHTTTAFTSRLKSASLIIAMIILFALAALLLLYGSISYVQSAHTALHGLQFSRRTRRY